MTVINALLGERILEGPTHLLSHCPEYSQLLCCQPGRRDGKTVDYFLGSDGKSWLLPRFSNPPPPNTHTLSLAADFSLWKQDGGGVCCFWDRILGVDCVTRLSCSSGQSFWPQFLPASLCPPSFHSVCGIMSRSWRRVLIIVFAGLVDA